MRPRFAPVRWVPTWVCSLRWKSRPLMLKSDVGRRGFALTAQLRHAETISSMPFRVVGMYLNGSLRRARALLRMLK